MGQTTTWCGGAGSQFKDPSLRRGFQQFFRARSFHIPRQCHGDRLETATGPSACYPWCDGLVGFRSGVHLSILTADCLPIFVRNRSGTRFALIHAGWKGLARRILVSALDGFFSEPVRIVIGSHIAQIDYEVGQEVHEALAEATRQSLDTLVEHGIIDGNGRVDLLEIARVQAAQAGVNVLSFGSVNMNTADPRTPLYSYRQNKTKCRMIHWIQKRT